MSAPAEADAFDVIIAGAGTTGIVAALAAAESGAKTCLIESSGYLGGTTFALGNVVGFHNNRGEAVVAGIPQKIVDRLAETGGVVGTGHIPNPGGMGGTVTLMDSGVFNAVAFEMVEKAEVELMLHTVVMGIVMDDNVLKGIKVVNKAGIRTINAPVVVDCTGDADIAVMSNAQWEKDQAGKALSATMVYRVGGVDHQAFVADLRAHPHKVTLLEDPFLREKRGFSVEQVMNDQVHSIHDLPYIYIENLVRDYIPKSDWPRWGITSVEKAGWGQLKPFGSRLHISASAISREVVYVNTTNVHFDATDPKAISRAEIEAQRQVKLSLELVRTYLPGFSKVTFLGSMPKISVRASRRIVGMYQLTREDISGGRHFDDSIARGCYPMSVQSATESNVRHHLYVKDGGDYGVPYGCLIPLGVEGLIVAGRCISATREASGSARIGAQCMAYGHAAGVAAALSAKEGVQPRNLNVGKLRSKLTEQGALV